MNQVQFDKLFKTLADSTFDETKLYAFQLFGFIPQFLT